MTKNKPIERREFLKTGAIGSACFMAPKALLGLANGPSVFEGFASVDAPHSARTVRVDRSSGVPRILVDGKPVRARFFFGTQGTRPYNLEAAVQHISFDFTARESASNGVMQLHFGKGACDISLGGIHVVDTDTKEDVIPPASFAGGIDEFKRDWTATPQDAESNIATIRVEPGAGPEGTNALRVTLQNHQPGEDVDFYISHQPKLSLVRNHHYQVDFWVRATPSCELNVTFYKPGSPQVMLGGRDPFPSEIKLAAASGISFVSFYVSPPWARPGTIPDWSEVDATCQLVLEANPNALLIPRVFLYPPEWWTQAHPDDIVVWDQPTTSFVPGIPWGNAMATTGNVSSPVYRRDAAEQLTALIDHLEEKFGSHIAGYHPAGQNTNEWFYPGTWDAPLSGYAKADLLAWRKWLLVRYANDEALQAAWHRPGVTRASADLVTPQARRDAAHGVFLDPATQQPVIDFNEFQQQMMADCVCELAHTVRQATQGRKLVLFFYGYVFEFSLVQNGPATSGHYALRQVLESPDIDILCAPLSYLDRGLDGSAPIMTAAESIALAGKMYLAEDDTRTFLAKGNSLGLNDGLTNVTDSQQVLLRNTSECALRNFATWWMDLVGNGWFDDRRLWLEMDRLRALDRPLLEHPTPYCPEVAAVIDSDSMMRVAFDGRVVSGGLGYYGRAALGRMGAPYGQYLLDDVLAGRVKAKLFVFLTAWHLSPEERKELLAATSGSTCIWCYAPGYLEGDHTSLEAMHDLTGFALKEVSGVEAWAHPSPLGMQKGLPSFGVKQVVKPLFEASDAAFGESLATYSNGSTAVAMRKMQTGNSIFAGAPALCLELLRIAAQLAKVHLYTPGGSVVFANRNYLSIHALQSGDIPINTGKSTAVHDLLSGEALGNGPELTLAFKNGETRILDMG